MAATRFALGVMSLLVVCAIAQAGPHSRILDGDDAVVGQFPHQASIRLDGVHVASGSIIGSWYLLTVAHPFSSNGVTPVDASRVDARVGSTNQFAGGQIVTIDTITIHPSYGNFLHDIAVIKLKAALTFTDRIASVALSNADDISEGTAATVSGWGLIDTTSSESSYKLQHTTKLTVLGAPTCELEAGYGYDSVLCLQHVVGEGICRGDEGAGVVVNDKLYGVASFAFGNCGSIYPDIAAKVSYYYVWINSQIAA